MDMPPFVHLLASNPTLSQYRFWIGIIGWCEIKDMIIYHSEQVMKGASDQTFGDKISLHDNNIF